MKVTFYDKNDPRIFLYKFPEHKWLGVTLNFAHVKAWKVLFWTLLPIPLLVGILLGLMAWLKPNAIDGRLRGILIAWAIPFLLYIIFISLYYFRMAAKDAFSMKNENEDKKTKSPPVD